MLSLDSSGGGDHDSGGGDGDEEELDGEGAGLNDELGALVQTVFECLSGSQQALRPGERTQHILLPLTILLFNTHLQRVLTSLLSHTYTF